MRPRRDPARDRAEDGSQYSMGGAQPSLEQSLAVEFRRFLRQQFNNDPTVIAYTFEVSPETARLWITTERLPRAEILYRMLVGFPAFAARLRLIVDNPIQPPRPRRAARRVA